MPLSKAYSLNFVFGGGGGSTNKNENENSRWKFFSRRTSSKKHRSTAALFTCRSQSKISELTPQLASILKENHDKEQCESCQLDSDEIVNKTLQPMSNLSDMYSNLPKNLSHHPHDSKKQASGSEHALDHSTKTSAQIYYMEKENPQSAASFFLRAAQKLNLGSKPLRGSKKMKKKSSSESPSEVEDNRRLFLTNFSDLIMRTPPQAPPSLFKYGTIRRGDGHGKVKVVLRIVNKRHASTSESCLTVDPRKKQVLLREASTTTMTDATKRFEKAPRLYSFDNIFTQESSQQELCAGTIVDLLHTVVNGNDACLLTYGYPKLGKSSIMIGRDDSAENVGIVPCAISWLYQLIDDRKQRTGARFSVRISAVEIVGKSENLKDLLGEQGNGSMCSSGGTSPSVYLPRERASSIQLSDFTELRAPTPEKAAFYFDAAVSSRTNPTPVTDGNGDVIEDPDEHKNSNMIFTLHVYQYMIDKVGTGEIHGGRSRFHLIDLSGCSRKKRSRDNGQGAWLPLSALGNVIVSVANGTRHIPHRNSKLTTLLREAMGSLSARVTMITNVSQDPRHCFETLSAFQVTSRIHRSRKRKGRYSSASSSGGDSSCDERQKHRRRYNKPVTPLLKTDTCQSDHVQESEFNSTSAAEESCDTVIYLGPGSRYLSDRDLTDFEHPPSINEEELPASNIKLPTLVQTAAQINCSSKKPNYPALNNKENCASSEKRSTKDENTIVTETNATRLQPIVVTINTQTMSKCFLEETANSLLRLSPQKQSSVDKYCKDDSCIQETKNLHEVSKHSHTLPNRNKNKSCSFEANEISNNVMNNSDKAHHEHIMRQSRSENSSPYKRAGSPQNTQKRRSCSLDRALLAEISQKINNPQEMCRSNETVSSTATVDNFERQLVSKIAERFAVEEEFRLKKASDVHVQDYYIDDDLSAIGADLNDASGLVLSNNKFGNPSQSLYAIVDESEHKVNDVINCNVCIGDCVCNHGNYLNNTLPQEYDSAEDTDERTDRQLRFQCARNRNSFSSCDSHLNSPRSCDKHPTSEGLSSGYESMRCESNANINLSDSSSEKGKSPRTNSDSVNKTIYELDDEIRGINVNDEHKTRFARTSLFRAQIKELINQRQDLKEELQQTLKRLVLNRVPLPDIDERLREISMQNRNTPQMLSRENRILERKVHVCKSHLELVDCLNNSTQRKTSKRRNPSQKLSSRIKSKLSRTPTTPRKAYKVTSV